MRAAVVVSRLLSSVTRRQPVRVTGRKVGGGEVESAVLRGTALAEEARWEEAQAEFEKAEVLDASDSRAAAGRAWCLEQQEKYTEAEVSYRRVVALNPDSPPAHVALADCLHRQNRLVEAADMLERLTSVVGDFPPALALWGQVLLDQDLPAKALEVLLRAARKGGGQEVQGSLGRAYLLLGRIDEAEKAARAAVADDQGDDVDWSTLGQVLYQKNMFEEARDCFAKAVALGGHAQYHVQRAAALLQLGQSKDALLDLEYVKHSGEEDANHVVNLMMGLAHEALGHGPAARGHFQLWLDGLQPGEEQQAEEIRNRIQLL